MKKAFLIILLSVFYSCINAQLLVENFDYPQGAFLTSNGWFTQYSTESAISVTNGLTFKNYAASNIGNAALLDVQESNQIHKSFTETTSGNVYVAFMFQPTIAGKDGWFFSLRDNKLDGTNFNFNGRIFITTDNKIGLTFGNNANKVYASTALSTSQASLIVLKYAIKDGNNNDSVSLFVFNTFPEAEPAKADIGPLGDAAVQDINPANIVMRSYSSNNWLVVDGIRVATKWEDAVKKAEESDLNIVDNGNRCYMSNGKLQLTIAQNINHFSIFDLTGKCLTQNRQSLTAGSYSIALKQGIYILKMDNSVQKVVVK